MLGTEVTVQLKAVADLHTKALTLLVPHQLGVGRFSTLAIVTTTPTPVTGDGGPQRYEVVHLDREAQAVES